MRRPSVSRPGETERRDNPRHGQCNNFTIREEVMGRNTTYAAVATLLIGLAGFSTPLRAETGQVAVVFTKGGFIVGVGGGEGVLLYRGHKYPFTVSGMSVGFTIGASTTKLVGRAINLRGPASIEGAYAAGRSRAGGVGGAR